MMNQLTTAYPTCPLRSPQVARSSQVKKRYHETYLRAKVYVNITQHLRIGAVGAKCGRPREKEKRRGGDGPGDMTTKPSGWRLTGRTQRIESSPSSLRVVAWRSGPASGRFKRASKPQ